MIEEYLADLTQRLQDVLNESLVGVYVHGSAALGDFSPARSDLDVLAVVDRRLSAHEKEAIAETSRSCPASGGLELHVVHECTIEPVEAPRFELHTSSGRVVDGSGHPGDTDLPMHFAVLRERGRALVGPPPATIFPLIPRALLLRGFAGELRWAEEHASPSYQVLNACRALRFLEEGALCSKLEGAEWARARGLQPGLVDAAVRSRRGLTEAQPSAELAAEFLREVRGRLEATMDLYVGSPVSGRRGSWLERRRMARLARDRLVRVTRSDVGVDVAGRRATILGELLLPPTGWRTWAAWGPWTFWASKRQVEWDDGGRVTDEDREKILRVLRDAVAQIRHLELDLD